jgi:cell division protein FtsB
MTPKDFITILVPVMVAVVSGLWAYLQVRKNSSVEGRKVDLSGYESLNKSQAAELERLSKKSDEDEAEIAKLRKELNEIRDKCDETSFRFNQLSRWTKHVSRIFNDPGIVRILSSSDVHIPPPPSWDDEPVAP